MFHCAADHGDSFYCVATNAVASTASSSATIGVSPVVTVSPSGTVTKGLGQPGTFTVTAVGPNLSYDWLLNGVSIGAPNSAVLSYSPVAADVGTRSVSCRVRGGVQRALSCNLSP